MSAFDQLRNLISSLDQRDRAAVLELVSQELGGDFPGIERTAGVCGGEPRIVRTRIPVWVLAQARRQGLGDAELLRAYPTLRAEDLALAWAYCDLHADEIDDQIRENESVAELIAGVDTLSMQN
jgi:uncharacterized protein (DUF433 family)